MLRRRILRPNSRRTAASIAVASAAAILFVLTVAGPSFAASPSSGSVGPSGTSTHWSGQSYVAGATASPGRLRCRWRRPLR